MKTTDEKPSSAILSEVDAPSMALYKQMRAQVVPSGGAEAATCETVLAMGSDGLDRNAR